MKVGAWLLEDRTAPRPELAQRLGVSVSTLKSWRRQAREGALPPLGRPTHKPEAHRKALWRVGRSLIEQGYPGFRAVKAACPEVPTRLVQLYVRRFKELWCVTKVMPSEMG